jgi:hypothetical protein
MRESTGPKRSTEESDHAVEIVVVVVPVAEGP